MKIRIFAATVLVLLCGLPVFSDGDDIIFNCMLGLSGEGAPSSGVLDLNVGYPINTGENSALLPYLSSNYRGNRALLELAEGGVLYQQSMSHGLNLKYIQHLRDKNFKFGFRTGYGINLIQEAKSESWGKGLYDSYQSILSCDMEKRFSRSVFKCGYNFYNTRFPNYESLASWFGMNQPGRYIYDRTAHHIFLTYIKRLSSKWSLLNDYSFILQNFSDQYVLRDDLNYAGLRSDYVNIFQSKISGEKLLFFPFDWVGFRIGKDRKIPVGFSLKLNAKSWDSNQNYMDVPQKIFMKDFYDHFEYVISPAVIIDERLSASYDYGDRIYLYRKARAFTGEYLSAPLRQNIQAIELNYSYPLRRKFSFFVIGRWQWASSNMDYEYNYYAFTYRWSVWTVGMKYEI